MAVRQIIVLATRNQGKLRELREMLKDFPVEIRSLADFGPLPEVVEDGATFDDNAYKKASFIAKALGLPAISDDSGLAVAALEGAPGVHSARYAGENADDRARIALLLERMQGKVNRTARFISAIAFCPNPSLDQVVVVRGEVEGTIGQVSRGEHGFGYDPVFILPDGRTMAEITLEEKSELSHRARAFENILKRKEKRLRKRRKGSGEDRCV